MRVFIIAGLIFLASIIAIVCTVNFLIFPLKYRDEIRAAAREYEIDPSLVAAVVRVESNFRPRAVSPKGAVGLMQIMPATAEYIAGKMGLTKYDLNKPADNIKIGTFYLRYLFNRFGDTRTVLFAYNAGEGNVAKWIGSGAVLTTCPFPETNSYAEKVLDSKNFYANRI
jgi:soluble lytic murein transglycosylase